MKYEGYDVIDKYVSEDRIVWSNTGCGSVIVGIKNRKKYFIKRNIEYRAPSAKNSPQLNKTLKEGINYIRNKQESISNAMKKGRLSFDDGIVVEEEHFIDGENFFVTISRFIEGARNFEALCCKLDFPSINAAFLQSAKLLNAIHKCGVIHGDLKLQNIIYVESGTDRKYYLIDFDSSYMSNNVPDWDNLIYSDGYESPECVMYKDSEDDEYRKYITYKTDVFTLGVMFYRLITGKFPTPKDGSALSAGSAIYYKIGINLDKKADIAIGPKNNASYLSLINWMLSADIEKRPTMQMVVDVLEDKASVDTDFCIGIDKSRYDELHNEHKKYADMVDKNILKAKGIKSIIAKIVDGKKYYQINNAATYSTIDDLFARGLAVRHEVKLDDTWPEDNIVLLNKDELQKKKCMSITKLVIRGQKKYMVELTSGLRYPCSGSELVRNGLARER